MLCPRDAQEVPDFSAEGCTAALGFANRLRQTHPITNIASSCHRCAREALSPHARAVMLALLQADQHPDTSHPKQHLHLSPATRGCPAVVMARGNAKAPFSSSSLLIHPPPGRRCGERSNAAGAAPTASPEVAAVQPGLEHTLLPLCSHSAPTLLTHSSHSAHTLLTCCSYIAPTLLPHYSLTTHTLLPHYSHTTHMVLPHCSHTTPTLLPRCSLTTHTLLTDYSDTTHRLLQGCQPTRQAPLSSSLKYPLKYMSRTPWPALPALNNRC